MADQNILYDVAIIGGGPGGMTAGIYSGRGLLKTLVIDKGALGGTVLLSSRIENFPAFTGGVDSFELAQRIETQLREHEVDIVMDNVTSLKFKDDGPLFEIVADDGSYYSKSIVLASGSTPRQLPARGAKEFFGRGVSTCAVCDGAFYKDKNVAVVGGGNAAVEESNYLTKFAKSVTIIHRRDQLRARQEFAKITLENPKIKFALDSVVEEVLGVGKVTGLKIRNVKSDEFTQLDVDGIFVYIGSTGNTDFIDLPLDRDELGYVKTGYLGETNIPGLFAVGDVRSEPYKQVIIACGHGAQAALNVDKYIKTM